MGADVEISEGRSPLTRVDRNRSDPIIVVTGCIDGTATIIDMSECQAKSAIQAHEQLIYAVTGGLD